MLVTLCNQPLNPTNQNAPALNEAILNGLAANAFCINQRHGSTLHYRGHVIYVLLPVLTGYPRESVLPNRESHNSWFVNSPEWVSNVSNAATIVHYQDQSYGSIDTSSTWPLLGQNKGLQKIWTF